MIDLERLFPIERHDDPAVERAVLGALITGALAWRDVAHLEAEDFYFRAHVDLLCAIEAAAAVRPARRPGIALPWAIHVARVLGCALPAGYIAAAARTAPRRTEALAAVLEARALRIARAEASQRRARCIEAFERWAREAAAFLLAAEQDREIALVHEPIEALRERRGQAPPSGRRAA